MISNGRKTIKLKKLLIALAALLLIPVLATCGCNSEKATFNWVRGKINTYYYEDLPSDCVYNGSVKQFVRDYLDQYSSFYTKEEYESVRASSAGNMTGLGVSYAFVGKGEHPSGQTGVILERVIGNSPAYLAGLRAGEFVKSGSFNGTTVEFTSADSFSDFLDGIALNKSFKLTTDKGGYDLSKRAYTASYCNMSTNAKSWEIGYDGDTMSVAESEGGIACLPDGAAYMRLEQFYGNAANEMGALIEEFNAENCTSLILDLRGNGGGYVDVMSDISVIYTGQLRNPLPTTGHAEYKNGDKEYFKSQATYPAARMFPAGCKLSVLADNGTASASEALIGVLISNGVADYSDVYISDFGEEYLAFSRTAEKDCRTYGKGIMQTTYMHPIYRYAIKLTTAKIYWPDGKTSIHGTGLGKDMGCKTVPAAWDVTYADEQLALAVEQIYGKTSDPTTSDPTVNL